MRQFYHGGAAGDIIYALPTIKELGGGQIVCGIASDSLYNSLKPLLESQPYIDSVRTPLEVDLKQGWINLDTFRSDPNQNNDHLVITHSRAVNLEAPLLSKSWLVLKERASPISEPYSVINRSSRHQDKIFNWKNEVAYLRKQGGVIFLGHYDEWFSFTKSTGIHIDYMPTKNHLEAAYYLYHAKMFSGNQSSLLAVRVGLGLPYRMEKSPFHNNCTTGRSNEKILNPITNRIHYMLSTLKTFV
jgi:hypothetical protein